MRNSIKLGLLSGVLLLTSCFNKREPNYQYMPNMYVSPAYETYQEAEIFPNQQEAQTPVEGTISRGFMPYEYEHSSEGYALAKAEGKNPLREGTAEEIEANTVTGGQLFDIYCAVCHGSKGDGQGILVKREKFLGVPNYKDRDITDGSIYYVIYYGLNSMGSYANQLNEKERWQVALYVEKLREDLLK